MPDVEAVCAKLEREGRGPFFMASGSPVSWVEQGEHKTFSGKLAWGYRGRLQIELLEPGQGSDFYRKDLDPNGRPVVQHLGFKVADVDASTKRLTDAGMPVAVTGRLDIGPILNRWNYVDAVRETGFYLDIHAFSLFNRPLWIPPVVIRTMGLVGKLTGRRHRQPQPRRSHPKRTDGARRPGHGP